jgi:hypothetical protein
MGMDEEGIYKNKAKLWMNWNNELACFSSRFHKTSFKEQLAVLGVDCINAYKIQLDFWKWACVT